MVLVYRDRPSGGGIYRYREGFSFFLANSHNRGESGVAAGAPTTDAGASSSGVTTVAASAVETPRRWARALRERAGASPRVRRAVSSTGRSTWIHWLALLWPMPNRRPCTTWRLYVFT